MPDSNRIRTAESNEHEFDVVTHFCKRCLIGRAEAMNGSEHCTEAMSNYYGD